MIYQQKNENGIISINEALLHQLVHEALRPWTYTNKLKLLPENKDHKLVEMGEKGIVFDIHVQLAMGESIELVSASVMDFIADELTSSLELSVEDIMVSIDGMFTRKGNTVPRNLTVKYSERKEIKA